MSAIAKPMPALSTLLRLGRISNLPTVWTNVIAGSAIAGDARPDQLGLIALAMTAFYVGGMYLNDFFDRAADARDRPGRPIDAGEITAGAVLSIGFGFLTTGVLLMMSFGLAAAACGAVLAAAIVLYDVWHKGNPLSPIVMGLCRALVYIGACMAVTGGLSAAALIGALALAFHVAGITYAAKQESLNRVGNLWPLLMLAVPAVAALAAATAWPVLVALVLLLAADARAVQLLAGKPVPGAVPLAVSGLIAAICLVDAVAVAVASAGGHIGIVAICALGYPLTRWLQRIIPGT
jgi:4-hydroxybenzoate polyprenyltransferase